MTPPVSLFLDAGGLAVAGFLHPPAATGARATGVLLLPPFGWDDQTSYRPRRDWAIALADAGYPALRLDLPGTGDSAGTPDEPDLLDRWLDAADAGAARLREAGAERIAVVGLGLGGLVAVAAAARGLAVDDLVLWAVPATGATLLREVRLFGRLEAAETGEDLDQIPAAEARGGGHRISGPTAAALDALDVGRLAPSTAPGRALLLGRDGRGPDAELSAALTGAGWTVREDPGDGWERATAVPPATSPRGVFALVEGWLAETSSPSRAAAPPPSAGPSSPSASPSRAAAPPPSATPVPSPASAPASAVVADGVRETPLTFGDGQFAVLAEPTDAPVADGTLVLFNAGALRHIGPNRMWTEAARRWAARGVPVLRVDVHAIGDADGDAAPYADNDELHTDALVAQAAAALDLAAERGLPQRFVVGGLCSGAFWALCTALHDDRVIAVVNLNQQFFAYDRDAQRGRELGKLLRIVTPSGFRHLLTSDKRLFYLKRLLGWLAAAPVRWVQGRRAPADPIVAALQALADRGQALEIGFAGGEDLKTELLHPSRAAALARAGVVLHDLPLTSHTLKPLAAQRAGHAVLDAALERHLHASPTPHLQPVSLSERRRRRPARTPSSPPSENGCQDNRCAPGYAPSSSPRPACGSTSPSSTTRPTCSPPA